MAISKIITDPEAMEKMIARYESAIEENKVALDKLLGAKSYENKVAEWEEKLTIAKKQLESANLEASEIISSANELLKEAQDQIKLSEAMKASVEKSADAQLKELAKINERANQIQSIEKKVLERETECARYQAELAEWVNTVSYAIRDLPGSNA